MTAADALSAPSTATFAAVLGSAAIDSRLSLSLDDLIKERRKENKHKKREAVKQESAKPTPTQQQAQKKKTVTDKQQGKRKDLVSKRRGLPMKETTATTTKSSNGNNTRAMKSKKTKASKATPSQVKGAKKAQPAGKKIKAIASSKAKQSNAPVAQKAKKSQAPLVKFGNKTTGKKQQPSLSPKQTKSKIVFPGQGVGKARKGPKLEITLVRSKSDVRRTKKKLLQQQQQQHRNIKVTVKKALLPGKSQPKTHKKLLAQRLIKSVKAPRKQQQPPQLKSKGGKFAVRRPVVVRKVRRQ